MMIRSHLIASDPTLSYDSASTVCVRCGKRRVFPSYIDRSYLKEPWMCEFDVWDKEGMNCDCPEKKMRLKSVDEAASRLKLTTPAIWGGNSMKTVSCEGERARNRTTSSCPRR